MNVQEFNKWLVTCVTSNPVRHKFSSCWSPHLLIIIGSFSNNCGDGSENVKKAKGLISKTTTLHMQQTFLYLSLLSLHHYGVKIPNFTCYEGCKQVTTNFSFSFKTWMWSPRNQLQGNSPTFDIFRELELVRQSLNKHEFIFKVTVSLPSPSLMLKLPSEFTQQDGRKKGMAKHSCVTKVFTVK